MLIVIINSFLALTFILGLFVLYRRWSDDVERAWYFCPFKRALLDLAPWKVKVLFKAFFPRSPCWHNSLFKPFSPWSTISHGKLHLSPLKEVLSLDLFLILAAGFQIGCTLKLYSLIASWREGMGKNPIDGVIVDAPFQLVSLD